MSADANQQEGKRSKPRGINELSIFLRSSSAVAVGITFLVQGINAGLAKALDNTGFPTVWNVLVLTAPMTLAVAAVTCIQLLARIVDNEKFLVFSVFSIPPIFIFSAIITVILGLHSGEQVRSALEVDPPISGIAHKIMAGQLIIRYWQVYGPGLFFSSILTGGLIGYVWYRVIAYRMP